MAETRKTRNIQRIVGRNIDDLVVVSLSHKWAPLDVVGSYETKVNDAYTALAAYTDEIVILATCNRFEVYALPSSPRFIDKVNEFLGENAKYARIIRGVDAARHLFRVASGLESAVIGENEVLGQVSRAYEYARSLGYAGKYMSVLFHYAIKTGKLARTKTMINCGNIGAPGAAVHAAERVIGGFDGRTVLVIGAGEAGSIIAKLVRQRYPSARLVILNRTYERAVALAKKVQGEAHRLDELEDYLYDADVVFVAVTVEEPIIKHSQLEKMRQGVLVVDVSNPPAVEHPVPSHLGYIGLSGIEKVVKETIERRLKEIPKVESIIEEQLKIFEKAWKRRTADEAITLFMNYASHVAQEELDELTTRLRNITSKDSDELEGVLQDFTQSLIKKLLRPLILYAHEVSVNGSPELLGELVKKFQNELKKRYIISMRHKS